MQFIFDIISLIVHKKCSSFDIISLTKYVNIVLQVRVNMYYQSQLVRHVVLIVCANNVSNTVHTRPTQHYITALAAPQICIVLLIHHRNVYMP